MERESKQNGWNWKRVIPCRYIMVIMSFLCFLWNYALRINMNIAVVAMVNYTELDLQNEGDEDEENITACPGDEEKEQELPDGPFVWDKAQQSLVISCLFWGYACTNIVGGRVAERFGAKNILGYTMLIAAGLTLITPAVANWGYVPLVILRILLGLVEGVAFPAMSSMISSWSPPVERGKMSALIYAGAHIGVVFGLAVAGFIIDLIGWEAVFYIYGVGALIWFLGWMILVYDSPEVHPWISDEERTRILNSLGKDASKRGSQPVPPLPWRAILTSKPFWSVLIMHMGFNWGYNLLLSELPGYMRRVLKFDIVKNGFLSSLPYLLLAGGGNLYALLMEQLQKRRILSATTVRKFSNAIAQTGNGLCLICVAYAECNKNMAAAFFAIAGLCMGACYAGHMAIHLDMAPNFAGTLFGLTNTAACFPAWIAPVTTALIVGDRPNSFARWRIVFWISAAITFFDTIEFYIWGSAVEQPWNKIDPEWLKLQGISPQKDMLQIENPVFEKDQQDDKNKSDSSQTQSVSTIDVVD